MEYTTKQISSLLVAYMKENNVSIYRICKETGLNKRTVERFINNGGYDPQISTANKLLTYLGYVGYIEKS